LPEWLVERGIGETRYARIEDGRIVEAGILVDGIVPAGTALVGKLKRSGFQLFAEAEGQDYLLPRGAPGVTEGASLRFEVTRERIPGMEAWKRPLGQPLHGAPRPADRSSGREIAFPDAKNMLGNAGWDELIEEARTGIVRFEGGELHIFPTPAMTLIDVDGMLEPERLAVSAAHAAAKAILRLGIGGSIGIDFPTVRGKVARTSIDSAIDRELPRPFERTSLNGFGFLQIVRPRRHASLIELAQDRPSFEARALLRRIAFEPHGRKRIVAHPAVAKVIKEQEDWTDRLARQVGGAIELRADAALPMSGGYAEPG
jgi:hypothetical protein